MFAHSKVRFPTCGESMDFDKEPTDDEALGMAWWNSLPDRARALWLQRVGTAVVADAWALFKAEPGISFDIGFQVGQESAREDAETRH